MGALVVGAAGVDGLADGNAVRGDAVPASPAMVGRDRELAAVMAALDRASTGTGAALLVTGEAGIGKTRLAAAAVEMANSRHFAVLHGRAQPLDRTLAFAPMVEAFGRFLRSRPPAERDDLTTGLPLLGQLVPGAGVSDTLPGPDATLQRTRLFEAALRLLGRIASAGPVVLLVDDLHWADSGTLELLDYLLRDLKGMPVLLMTTYRPEEAAVSRVGAIVGTIHRTVDAHDVALSRLDDDGVAAVLTTAIGSRPSPDLVQLVVDRSLGVPLYVEAYGRWLVESGMLMTVDGAVAVAPQAELGVPPAIRGVIAGRLDSLSPHERDVVGLLAVGGEQADVDLLTAVGGPAVRATLDSLVARGLIAEADDGPTLIYRAHHPLVHEVAYSTMPASRRRDLHAGFVDALRGSGDPAALAPHVEAAGAVIPPAEAARMMLDAGRAAFDRFAYEDATSYVGRALELAERACPDLLGEILTAYGHALRFSGEASAAVRAWQRALEHTSPDDATGRATLHQLVADAHSDRGEITAAVHEVEAALAALGDQPPTLLHMELLFVLMMNHQRQLDVPAAAAVEDRIRQLAGKIATAEAKLMASLARMGILLERAQYQAAMVLGESLSHQLVDHPTIHLQGVQFRALEALAMGDLGRLRHANAELAVLDQRIGIPGWNYRRYLYAFGEALYRGTWDEAQDILDEFELAVTGSENSRAATIGPTVGALLAAYRDDPHEAERRLQSCRKRIEQGLVEPEAARGVLGIFGALAALERGDAAAALKHIEPVASSNPYVLAGVIPPWGLVALAEARARTRDAEGARTAAAQLAQVGPDGTYPQVMARRLAGLAAHADGDRSAAYRLLLEARAGFERLRLPFETARAAIEAAEIGAADGPADLVASAHRVMATLGAGRYEARAGRLMRAAGAAVPRGGRPAQAGLTPRQQEVAELVATGISNAEIAERLFVSIRTVTAHLDHIYTRLNINSRAALAAYVTERRHQDNPP